MARVKKEVVHIAEDALLSADLSENQNQMALHQQQIMDQFGEGLPYERGRIVHEARFYMTQSAEAMLEAGKRLVILKENEPHGDFVSIVEEQLGLHVRAAQRMMKASLKYLSPQLESKATTLSLLGKAKLFELVAEDDEELAELADGGTVAGLTLDDVDRMSVRELRQALRTAREDADAQRRILSDKNTKIDELSTKLEKKSRIQPPAPDEEVKKLRAEVTALSTDAESAITVRLYSAFEALSTYCAENQIDTPRDFMAGLVCELEQAARNLRSTFDLPDEPTGNAAPSWLTDPTPQINGQEA